MICNSVILAWIFIKQPRLAHIVWRARHDIPELRRLLRTLDVTDRQ